VKKKLLKKIDEVQTDHGDEKLQGKTKTGRHWERKPSYLKRSGKWSFGERPGI